MRIFVLSLVTLLLSVVVAGSCAVRQLEDALLLPADAVGRERMVLVQAGDDLTAVVQQLAEADLFARPGWVRFYADHLREEGRPVAGEYALSSDLSAIQQIDRLLEGEVVTYTVNLTPGLTADEMAIRFEEAGVVGAEALRPLMRDRDFLKELAVEADSIEGYLFPDPYTLPKGLSARALLQRLVDRYRAIVGDPELEPDPDDPLTEHQRLILASLVQKSAVRPSEWRLYAALLRNRLRVGLPLEVEAAETYGARQAPNEKNNPWSTRRAGLPPTPICNPGIDALTAVVRPAQSEARYMVARSNGTHVFCRDLECHRAAIRRWNLGLPPVAPGIELGPDGLPLPPPDAGVVDAGASGTEPEDAAGGFEVWEADSEANDPVFEAPPIPMPRDGVNGSTVAGPPAP